MPVSVSELGIELAWWLRNTFTWSLPAQPRRHTLAALQHSLPPSLQSPAQALAQRYAVQHFANCCDAQGFRESLYVLDILDRYIGPPIYPHPALDVGCKNGCYLPGLQAWSPGAWHGVELDAQRRYWNMTTRYAQGQRIASALPNCRYIAANLLQLSDRYGFITWFLPFLHHAPLHAWGLPQRFLMPEQLLEHAWSLLKVGGGMLLVNQGEAEAERQARLFASLGISAQSLGRLHSLLSPFKQPRFGWLVLRT